MRNIQEISMHDIETQYAPGIGRHWFDPDTLRFFKTRLPLSGFTGAGGTYFVTSEKGPGMPRRYSVRRLAGPGRIETVGEFCGFTTAGTARTCARNMADGRN